MAMSVTDIVRVPPAGTMMCGLRHKNDPGLYAVSHRRPFHRSAENPVAPPQLTNMTGWAVRFVKVNDTRAVEISPNRRMVYCAESDWNNAAGPKSPLAAVGARSHAPKNSSRQAHVTRRASERVGDAYMAI
jgi:hypothetical protein